MADIPSWLRVDATAQALKDDPQLRSDISDYLRQEGRTDTPEEWLYGDLLNGDPNGYLIDKVKGGASYLDMIAGVFNSITPVNNPTTYDGTVTPVTQPPAVIDRLLPTDKSTDNSGLFSQLSGFLTALIGGISRPDTNLTVAPVTTTANTTNTAIDNRQTFSDNSSRSYDSSYKDSSSTYTDASVNISNPSLSEVGGFVSRVTDLLSVPRGNDINSPAAPLTGYAQNLSQSGQRTGETTVATVAGFGVTGNGLVLAGRQVPWKTVIAGSVVSLGLFILYRKFFK